MAEVSAEGRVGLKTYVDVFQGAVKGPNSSAAVWATVWFVAALGWLILAFMGTRGIGRE